MEIKDLKDPRDREAMERAQRADSVHNLRRSDNYNRRVQSENKPIAGYDDLIEAEFQGKPHAQRKGLPKNINHLRFGKQDPEE